MSPEQWETVRLNHERTCSDRDRLRVLLDQASQALPANHAIQSEIRQALGLRVEIPA